MAGNPRFLNLEGRIREGRSKETEETLLWKLDEKIKGLAGDDPYFLALTTFNRCMNHREYLTDSSDDREWYSVATGG